MREIVLLTCLHRRVVVVPVRLAVTHEVRPPDVHGEARLTDLVLPRGALASRVDVRVGTDVAPVDETRETIHRDPVRIAMSHRIDLGAGAGRAAGKEVSFGNRVRTVRLGMNPDDL